MALDFELNNIHSSPSTAPKFTIVVNEKSELSLVFFHAHLQVTIE